MEQNASHKHHSDNPINVGTEGDEKKAENSSESTVNSGTFGPEFSMELNFPLPNDLHKYKNPYCEYYFG